MAKPRVFISSTFYDLKHVRTDLDVFLDNIGYESVRNEEGDIPYGKNEALEAYCYKEIKSVDILLSIIGGRFGSLSKFEAASISQRELRTALSEQKQVYIFIEKNVLSEYETYLLNKEHSCFRYKYVDDVRIYQFIEEIKGLSNNNNIKSFENSTDITTYLKDQFSGLFQRLLESQSRIKEISLISNLEKTVQTLNKLVNFLSDENKGNKDEVNKILMINHPLIYSLKEKLKINYNFYIEGYSDLCLFLATLDYQAEPYYSESTYDFYCTNNNTSLMITSDIFSDGKLKYIRANEWNENWVEVNRNIHNDDLPF